MWSSDDNDCSYIMLEIKKNGDGLYGYPGGFKGCNMNFEGKVRFNKKHLYVGTIRLNFIDDPEYNNNNDSIFLRQNRKKYKIIASMTVIESKIIGNNKHTFYKIQDY